MATTQGTNYFLFGLTTGEADFVSAFVWDSLFFSGVAAAAAATFIVSSFFKAKALASAPRSKSALTKSPVKADDDYPTALANLERLFNVPADKLNQIVKHMVSEMKRGLHDDNHGNEYLESVSLMIVDLKMIPSHVVRRPKGNETGSFLALDLGGSNFRVCEVTLEGNGITRMRQKKFSVSEQLKTGSGKTLFDFFADCVAGFLEETGNKGKSMKLGFTFSFPFSQPSISKGYLMYWTKGFSAAGVEGEDVGYLLQEAFNRKGLKISVTALVNDTTGTLMSHAYSQPNTCVGVILGTGTNAAYVEQAENIVKLKEPVLTNEMVINTEWGAFDEEHIVLPRTKYDLKVDRGSLHPRLQTFEKLISGLYLGEVVRYVLIDLIKTGEIFNGASSTEMNTPYKFDTAFMSRIERDHTVDLSDTKIVLEEIMGIAKTTRQDRRIVRGVCELVGRRSARLAAAGVAAIVTKINRLDGCTVAIDGSLFELYPHYANRMRDALREILGISAENIILEQGSATTPGAPTQPSNAPPSNPVASAWSTPKGWAAVATAPPQQATGGASLSGPAPTNPVVKAWGPTASSSAGSLGAGSAIGSMPVSSLTSKIGPSVAIGSGINGGGGGGTAAPPVSLNTEGLRASNGVGVIGPATPTSAVSANLPPPKFKYTRELLLSLYDPELPPPPSFIHRAQLTVDNSLEPLANIPLTEIEKKVLSSASVNSETMRRTGSYREGAERGEGGGRGGRGRPAGLQTGGRSIEKPMSPWSRKELPSSRSTEDLDVTGGFTDQTWETTEDDRGIGTDSTTKADAGEKSTIVSPITMLGDLIFADTPDSERLSRPVTDAAQFIRRMFSTYTQEPTAEKSHFGDSFLPKMPDRPSPNPIATVRELNTLRSTLSQEKLNLGFVQQVSSPLSKMAPLLPTPKTSWFYRDPSGATQPTGTGSFASSGTAVRPFEEPEQAFGTGDPTNFLYAGEAAIPTQTAIASDPVRSLTDAFEGVTLDEASDTPLQKDYLEQTAEPAAQTSPAPPSEAPVVETVAKEAESVKDTWSDKINAHEDTESLNISTDAAGDQEPVKPEVPDSKKAIESDSAGTSATTVAKAKKSKAERAAKREAAKAKKVEEAQANTDNAAPAPAQEEVSEVAPAKPVTPVWGTDSIPKPSLKEIQEAEAKAKEEREKERAKKAHQELLAQAQALAEKEASGVKTTAPSVWAAPVKATVGKAKANLMTIMQEEERKRKEEAAAAAAAMAAAAATAAVATQAAAAAAGGKRYADLASSSQPGSWAAISSHNAASSVTKGIVVPAAGVPPAPVKPQAVVAPTLAVKAQDQWNVVGKATGKQPSSGSQDAPSDAFLAWCRQALRPLERSSTATVQVEDFIQMLLCLEASAMYDVCNDTLGGLTAIDPRKFADEFIKRKKMDSQDQGWSVASQGNPSAKVPTPAAGGVLRDFETSNSFTVVGGGKVARHMTTDLKAFDDDALHAEIAKQGDLIKALKAKKVAKDELQVHVDRLVSLKAEAAERLESKKVKNKFDRTVLEGLLLKRFFYAPSFAIYGGVAGLFDYGPPGTALLNNIITIWRRHFVLEEDMLEIECTNLTPESVFKTSGHVDRFTDEMVRDSKTGDIFRADHLVKQVLKARLEDDEAIRAGTFDKKKVPKGKPIPTQLTPETKADYELVLESLDNYTGDALWQLMQRLEIKAPETGNDLTEPKPFNLMFETQIGPTGQFKGEFTMAEIEHYVDPTKKQHAKFSEVKDIIVPLYPAKNQLSGAGPIEKSIGDAVAEGIINNETLGYFIARIYLFLLKLGVKRERLRFRQHMVNEMAHYACDCWDAEINCSYGWIECVGCADRSAYDLSAHTKATKEKLVVREPLETPIIKDHLVLEVVKSKIGPKFRGDAKAVYGFFDSLRIEGTEDDWEESKLTELDSKLNAGNGIAEIVGTDGKPYTITTEMVSIFRRTDKINDLGNDDENRHVLSFPAPVAPIKALILPISNNDDFRPFLRTIADQLRASGVSTRVDSSSTTIGKRYARNDELGTPFAITVDFQTVSDSTVTLRERDSLKQIRASIPEIINVVKSLVDESITWNEVIAKYPEFTAQEL
ncbi:Glycine--tRNA ligase 1, mitochondrial [Phlyctochytrium bullatum]|nr:Glycine--tRNA ligase 1, mitochondrial [Phlyctochytrium bullatum]